MAVWEMKKNSPVVRSRKRSSASLDCQSGYVTIFVETQLRIVELHVFVRSANIAGCGE